MFFVFHILVLTGYLISKINSFAVVKEVKPDGQSLPGNEKPFYFQDASQRNGSTFSTYQPFFQIIQNLTKTKSPNLKSNVFDKMLSDEMFSIKQHFYEKDMTYSSSVHISTQSNAPTPTLVVKQKWPFAEFMSKLNRNEETEHYAEETDNFNEVINKTHLNDSTSLELNISEDIGDELETASSVQQNLSKVKVIDLRSLPESTLNPIYYSKVCTCMKTNQMTTCTHRCTGSNSYHKCTRFLCNSVSQCPHTVSKACPKCTSYSQYSTTLIPYTIGVYPYNFYVPYQPYLRHDSTEIPYKNTYYYPDVLNEFKIPEKPKRRMSTRHYRDDDLYYDSEESLYEEYLENDKLTQKLHGPKAKHKESNGDILKLPIDYDHNADVKDKLRKKVAINAGVYDNDQNKFVNDIIKDLKTYYGDTVIKDCYCSRSQPIWFPAILLWMCALFAFAV